HLQVAQVGEGGEAAAEVVEDEAAAFFPQLRDEAHGAAELAAGGGLGDLEADAPGVHAAFLELFGDVVEETLLADRLAGDVDGEEDARALAPLRLGEGAEGGLQHPAVERGDEVVALRRGDEGGGLEDLTGGIEHAEED